MKLQRIASGFVFMTASCLAGATTSQDLGTYTVTYDETSPFGLIASTSSTSNAFGTDVGFNWVVPSAVQVSNSVPATTVNASYALPNVTVTVDPGWTLNGPLTVFLGNLSYAAAGGTVSIQAVADVSVNGGPAVPMSTSFANTVTGSGPGFTLGYLSETYATPVTGLSTISITNASIMLSAAAGSFVAIGAQPQNVLSFDVAALPDPVPEPGTYLMLLSGVLVLGWVVRRRRH